MATLTLDGPSAAADVLSTGVSTPVVQNMYGGTSKPLISITSNANSAVSFTKVNFKIRVDGELDIASGKTLTLANSYISENSTGLKLTKTGGGTLAFSGSSSTKITFTGGLDMQEGTWIASQNSSSLPASGWVNFTNSSGTNAKITVNAASSIEALAGGNADSSIDGNSTLTVSGAQITTYGGSIGGSVALSLSGSGSLALTGTNSYSGLTTISAGSLKLGHATNTLAGAIRISGGTLDVDNPDTLGAVTLTSGTISGDSALTGTSYAVESGTVSTELSGSGVALAKTTGGTVTLSGTNTYTGATIVSAGTLLVTGALGASDVTVNGGTFGGTGTVGGGLDMVGGSFHVANLLNPLDVTGIVTIYSGFGIDDLAGLNWVSVSNGTYTLINGTLGTGVFDSLANNSLATAYDLGGGRSAYFEQASLELVVIPEPRTALLGGFGLLALLRRRR